MPFRRTRLLAGAVAVVALALPAPASAAPRRIENRLFDPAGGYRNYFGAAVATDGERVVVGAPGATVDGTPEAGAVFVFERTRDGWAGGRLPDTLPRGRRRSGAAVAVDRRWVVVGVPGDRTPAGIAAGTVVVYEADGAGGWTAVKLHDPTGDEGDDFGAAVAADEGLIVVGAAEDGTAGQDAGSVLVFERDGTGRWRPTARLVDPDPAVGDRFGQDVDVDGGRIVVATRSDETGTAAGAVVVFERDGEGGWTPTALVAEPDAAGFGSEIGVSGRRLAVGAPDADTAAGERAGEVLVYELGGDGAWHRAATLTDPAAEPLAQFGVGVDVDGDTVVAGSLHESTAAAFTAEPGGTWSATPLVDPIGHYNDLFGSAVAVEDGLAVVGAPWDLIGPYKFRGSAMVFNLDRRGSP